MRKPVMIVLVLLMVLFPPYWISGLFDDDIGWCFLFGDYFYLEDLSWSLLVLEVVVLLVLNAVWRRAERAGAPAPRHVAAPQPSAAPVDVAGELGKLNELRQSGALTQDEFETQKARLMGAAAQDAQPARTVAAPSAPSASVASPVDGYPTAKIANAVEVLRAAGLEEKMIAGPANRWLWQAGKPMPPGPYLADEPAYLGGLGVAMGLLFAVLWSVTFALLTDAEITFGMFVFLAVAFGGGMVAVFVVQFNRIKAKHALPAWRDIPG